MSYESDLSRVKERYDAKVHSGELQGNWEPMIIYWLRKRWLARRARRIERAAVAMWEADDAAYVERAAKEGRQVGRVLWEDANDPVTQPDYRRKASAALTAARSTSRGERDA